MKIPMNLKRTRRFNGKVYKLREWYFGKTSAEITRDTLRMKGYYARVTTIKAGPTGSPIYLLWFRLTSKPPIRPRRR